MSSIIQAAIADARKIISGGFGEALTLSTPSGDMTIQIKGLASKHHLGFDMDGNVVSSKNAHVCVSEKDLSEAGYPVRNAKQEINLHQHKVSFKDSSGVVKNYVVRENFPDETLGLITLILGDWE